MVGLMAVILAIWDSSFRRFVRVDGGSFALGDAMAKPRDDRQKDLLRPALEAIIDLGHPLVRLAPRSIGSFSTGGLPACARRAPGSLVCRPGW